MLSRRQAQAETTFLHREKREAFLQLCVHCLVGAEFFGGPYTLTDNFSFAQQVQVFM